MTNAMNNGTTLNPPTPEQIAADEAKLAQDQELLKQQEQQATAAAAARQAQVNQQDVRRVKGTYPKNGPKSGAFAGEHLGVTPAGDNLVAVDEGNDAKPVYAFSPSVALTTVAVLMLLFLAAGCSALSAPPTALEQKLFTVQTNLTLGTNWVTQTNTVNVTNTIYVTNAVTQQVYSTNVVMTTNVVTVTPIPTAVTNYTFTGPSPQAAAATNAASTTLNAFAPGDGTILSLILAGAAAIWGGLRSSAANKQTQVSGSLSQALATAQSVLAAASPSASQQFNAWLAAHQNDTNLATEIAQVVDSFVDPTATHGIATSIVQQATTPIPVPAPLPAASVAAVPKPAA